MDTCSIESTNNFPFSSNLMPFRAHLFKVNGSPGVASIKDINNMTRTFHLAGTLKNFILEVDLDNEAIIQIYCHLYANSTGNITLLVRPKTEWNVTQIKVGIGQEINVTVQNGVVKTFRNYDVSNFMDLYVKLENKTDEVWGIINALILTRGWNPIPYPFIWPFIPGVLALFLFYVKRSRRPSK